MTADSRPEATLGEIAVLSKEKADPQAIPDAAYLGLEHIESGTKRILDVGRAADVKSTKSVFGPGDILYGKLRPYLNKVAIPDFSGVCSTDILVLRPAEGVDREFLAGLLSSPALIEYAHQASKGVELPRVGWKELSEFPVPLPPLEEQRRIAAYLDEVDTRRELIAGRLAAAGAAIDRVHTAVLAAACSGRLTADWRDEHPAEPPPDLDSAWEQRRGESRRFAEPALNPHTGVDELPEKWRVAPLGLLLTDLQYGTSKRCAYETDGMPVLRIPNVSSGVVRTEDLKFAHLDEREAAVLELRSGDLLMVRSNGSVGLVGLTVEVSPAAEGMAFAGYLLRLRLDARMMIPGFLRLALASSSLRRQIEIPARSTSGVHNINSREVRSLGVPIPPLAEQREIVARADAALATADRIGGAISAANDALAATLRSALARAFDGEVSTA